MRVDGRAMIFALAAVVITTFVFGLAPALRAAEPSAQDELKAGGRAMGSGHQRRLRSVLVTAEVALAVILLVDAGLLVRSFASVIKQDRGYRPDHVLSATLFVWQWNRTPSARHEFIARLVGRAATLPGVSAAGATSSLPLSGAIGADRAGHNGSRAPCHSRPGTAGIRHRDHARGVHRARYGDASRSRLHAPG